MEVPRTVALDCWIKDALKDRGKNGHFGIEFYELTDGPIAARGLALLRPSCKLLDAVRADIGSHGVASAEVIPYVNFRLPSTARLLEWRPNMWGDISGGDARIELTWNGALFYWGVFESYHKTVEVPVDTGSHYAAIFHCHRGFYENEPWAEYENEIYIFAPPECWFMRHNEDPI